MATLNIRDFPDELLRQTKTTAASEHMTIKAFVIQALESRIPKVIHVTVTHEEVQLPTPKYPEQEVVVKTKARKGKGR